MKLFITGATGLIGRRLVLDRLERGDEVVALSRDGARAARVLGADETELSVIEGDPSLAGSWPESLDGCEAVVHLAGAPIATKRWTAAYKALLVESRLESTRRVVEALKAADRPPGVFICASAIGYYGACGGAPVDETAPPGGDFLAQLAARWEEEARKAEDTGARVVSLRIAMVLDERGGALAKLVPVFRLFVGGPIGTGKQYMPWVHWRDVVGLVDLALRDGELAGPLNAVGPELVTNRVFSRTMGEVLGRPSLVPTPPLALRVILGELARYVTMSQRVAPERARRHGYAFAYPQLRPALEALVGRGVRG